MKKILSSKGIFSITNSLYENIKKNNPELLMEDEIDSSFHIDLFDKMLEKAGLNKIRWKDGKELIDFLKKFPVKSDGSFDYDKFINDASKEKNKKIFIDTIKNSIGENNFKQISNKELNNWFNQWNRKDENGKEKIFNEIGKKLKEKFSNEKESFKPKKEKSNKKINNRKNDDEKYSQDEEQLLNDEEFNDNDDFNMDVDTFDEFLKDNKMSEKTFKKFLSEKYSELFGENPENVIRACERVIGSMKKKYGQKDYESTFPNKKERIKKWYNAVNKEINDFKKYLKELEKNGLLTESDNKKSKKELFKLFAQGGMKKVEAYNDSNNIDNSNNIDDSNTIDNIDKDFKKYINDYKFEKNENGLLKNIKIKEFIRRLLNAYKFPEKYLDITIKRYMDDFRETFSDEDYLKDDDESNEIRSNRYKRNMNEIYDKVKDDCERLNKIIELNKNKNIKGFEYDTILGRNQ